MESIEENVKRVFERLHRAAERAGRDPAEITLVAASKMNGAGRVREAFDAGIRVFGENRVQELEEKLKAGAYEGAQLHFIGHLQRNKVKNLVGKVDLIESVDSEELISMISRRAVERGITQDILLEVNIGGEASKSGVEPEELGRLADAAAAAEGVFVKGIMAIPPASDDISSTRRYFDRMYKLFVDMSGKKYDNITMKILSMGMSADFEEAVMAGANMVRVGTAVFGQRHYN